MLTSLQAPGPGTRNAERNQKKHTGDHFNNCNVSQWLDVESSGRRASNLILLRQEVASSGSIESLCLHVSLVHIECPTGSFLTDEISYPDTNPQNLEVLFQTNVWRIALKGWV